MGRPLLRTVGMPCGILLQSGHYRLRRIGDDGQISAAGRIRTMTPLEPVVQRP